MSDWTLGPWLVLLVLGASHGLNPAMGWLFAVALGLQEKRAGAVWRALPPLALGHALAIAAAIMLALALGTALSPHRLKWAVAAALLGFGVHRLVSGRHPRYGGMRVGPRDLTLWSLLMASAHGAGLMVMPLFLRAPAASPDAHQAHVHQAAALVPLGDSALAALAAAGVHAAGYLLVTGVIALLVYWKLGLRMLRSAWINLDLLWAGALIVTAVGTPLL